MHLDFKAIQSARAEYTAAYGQYMNGQITWEQFYPIQQEWKKASSSLSKARRENDKQIERDLALKYGN